MRHRNPSFLVLLPLVIAAHACTDDDSESVTRADAGSDAATTPAAPDAEPLADAGPLAVAIAFEARIAGQAFHCGGSYPALGTTNATVSPEDLRFFVSDVKLLRAGTGEAVAIALGANAMQNADVALLDFEDKTGDCASGTTETNDTVTGSAPFGSYDGIEFTIGVPEALNHIDIAGDASAPLLGSNMQWGWTAGFKFVSLGLVPTTAYDDGGLPPTFYTHLGSGGCAGNTAVGEAASCTRSNRPHVQLTGFDPRTSKIVIDLKSLYSGSDLMNNTPQTPGGCMSGATDPECPPLFDRLGIDDAGASFASPAIFSVSPK